MFAFVGDAGNAILFMVSFVGLVIWSLIYLLFASHYFLTTLTDSSAGHDEVQYPREGMFDWWWKPIFCVWVLAFWLIPVTVLLAPLAAFSPLAFAIVWFAVLWIVYPMSLMSTLHTGNWFFFLHPVVVWRAVRHWKALAYVHFITILSGGLCVGLLIAAFAQNIWWAALAAFLIPTSILFYARNWGRFAWLSLNFVPRKRKAPRDNSKKTASAKDGVPEMDVEEIDPAAEGIRPGLPPGFASGLHEGVPLSAGGFAPGASPQQPTTEDADEWSTDKKPYLVIEDGAAPPFEEQAETPIAPAVAQVSSAPPTEEEDEWATEKKPYGVLGDPDFTAPTLSDADDDGRPEANKPIQLGKHYDERHERESEEKRKAKAEADKFGLPAPSKKTPTFANALFFGVWGFMIYERTLTVWANLIVLTIVELFFVYLTRMFFPRVVE